MEANKILSSDILDIIFEGKNKEYGAYNLRRTYNRRVTWALIITAAVALLIFLSSLLANAIKNSKKLDIVVKDISLSEVKKEEKKPETPPPPPPKLPPPPKVETIKFTPPKIVKDEEVKKDEIPPEIEKIQDTRIDVKSQEGIKDEGIVAPAVSDKGSNVVEVKENEDEKIFTKVEKEAEFPGGSSAWRRYLERNLNPQVPLDNGAPPGIYTVIIRFVVSRDGAISDVQCESDPGYGMCDEAKKIIRKGPSWTPALQNGRNVNAYRRQPITFQVEEQ